MACETSLNAFSCADMPYLICPLCPVERTAQLNLDLKNYLKHIKLFHSHQPSFSITCGLGGCLRTFSNFQVFRNHISTYHSSDPMLLNEESTLGLNDDNVNAEDENVGDDTNGGETSFEDLGSGSCDLQKSTAMVLMGLKEKYKLTQVALQGVIASTTSLVQCRLSELHSLVRDMLLSNGISPDVVSHLEPLFTDNGAISNPFKGLETKCQQMNFYRTHFNLIVSLQF